MSVVVDGLTRTFQAGKGWRPRGAKTVALAGLSLSIEQGEVHGLLGPNGAGKTTLCKILSTVLLPTEGCATVAGYDVVRQAAAVRGVIGIVFGGERGLYSRLTGRQNLSYWSALYKVPDVVAKRRVTELLNRVGITDRADALVETYSRGMKQRLHLARGLLADPRVMLFDEPTIGMDPVAARDFRVLIDELRAEGRTILLTTHDMAEAEAVCDRVTLIDHGSVLATETPRALAEIAARSRWIEAEGVTVDLLGMPGVIEVVERGATLRVRTDGETSARAMLNFLLDNGVTTVRAVPPTLTDVYLDIIGSRGMQV